MILVDINEPDNIVKLLKQSCPVVVNPLNIKHMSDYFFGNYEGKTFQFSRKQAPELLGNLDEAEEQIRDYYEQADYNFQIVEGLIDDMPFKGIPVKDRTFAKVSSRQPQPTIYGYKMLPDRSLEGNAFDTIHTIAILYAWEHRLTMAGVPTYWTSNSTQTAKLLSAIYHNEQKPPDEHQTLKRVIRPRLQVKDAEPFMKILLYLSAAYHLDVGEKRAKLLFDKFANILDLATADIADISSIEGIGINSARKILTALGRTV